MLVGGCLCLNASVSVLNVVVFVWLRLSLLFESVLLVTRLRLNVWDR